MAASLGNATVNVLARTVLFEQSLKRSLKRMSALTAVIFSGVAAANFLGSAVKDSLELEKSLARIQTLLNTEKASQGLKKMFGAEEVRALSNELGISAIEVSEALYYMVGSGVAAADAFDAVRGAASTAIATNSDLAKTADFTSTALNAYGGTVDKLTGKVVDAAHANDILFRALADGKGTMNDFSKYVSTAIPIASQLGISLSEVSSFAAANTLTGSSARKVFTGLAYTLRGLNNDTKGVGKAFTNITGKTFKEFVKEGGNVREAIEILGKEIGSSQISNIGGAETGLNAIQQTLGLWEKYTKTRKNVADADGQAAEAMKTVNNTTARQLEILKNQFNNFRGSVGDWLGPIIGDALAWAQSVWPSFQAGFSTVADIARGFSDVVGQVVDKVQELNGVAVDRLQAALSSLWQTIQDILPSVWTFVTTVGDVLTPVAGALAVVIGVIATTLAPIVVQVVDALLQMVNALISNKDIIATLTVVVGAFVAVLWLQRAASYAVYLAAGLYYAAAAIATTVTTGWVGAFWALNAAMYANPVGLIIAAVVALTAGFIYAWKSSETFREVVVKVLNAVIDAAVFAASTMFKSFTWWIKGILKGIRGAANAWSKLPDILGGGIAADISGAVSKVINGLDAVQKKIDSLHGKNITIGVQVTLERFSAANSDSGFNARAAELATGTGESISSQMDSVKDDIAAAIGGLGGGGGSTNMFDGGGGGGGASQSGKDAAKKAATALKDALKKVKGDLDRIAKSTSKQTIDQIKNNFDALYEDLKGAGGKKLIKAAEAVEKKLLALAKRRDKVDEKLDSAKKKLEDLREAYFDLRTSIVDAGNAMGAITRDTGGVAVTFTGMRNNLRKSIAITKEYAANIRKLMKLNLNKVSLQQLIDAGPEAGAAQARVLAAGGSVAVGEINKLQTELGDQSKSLGTSVAENFYRAGVDAARGLVAGLESEQAAIVKQMDKIADKLVESIKKKLKIKSPSRVFGEVGENISKGLAGGILDAGHLPSKAAATVSQNITFGPGSIAVSGGKQDDPRRGMLLGQGIVGVLEQRKVAAQLTGTG